MAYAWQESFESLAWVIGPPLGGVLAVAFGTGKALGLDSLTFLVSVAGLIAIRKRFEPAADEAHEPMWASIRSGLRLMIVDRVLRRDQLVWSLYSILGGSIVLGLVYVSTKGGRNDAALATLAVAAYAAGSAVGTLLAARFEGARTSGWPRRPASASPPPAPPCSPSGECPRSWPAARCSASARDWCWCST